ncbi:MAG: UMP kinase [Candidatus Woesearchaeota archaeon]|nr:MAG: UMP kinase [Candidatus Woesearchaeota archaeon]
MVVVISLGGSLIVPDKINYDYLKKFRSLILKLKSKKFIIVTGGGSTARNYINPLEKENIDERTRALIGIGITRTNAWFMLNFFKKHCAKTIPNSLKELKNLLEKNRIVFCGGLHYMENNTSDGTAAAIANLFKTDLINMTNVKGLYTKDPRLKGANLIKKISFDNFDKKIRKIKYKPGQHFVLDQNASQIIKKHKIKTYILGPDLNNLKNLIEGKKFIGTTIS